MLLEVNFDNKLVEVLREVHYLILMSGEGICENKMPADFESLIQQPIEKIKEKLPTDSIALFEKSEPLREARLKLNQITDAYNTIRQDTYTVEYPLIANDVTNFDKTLAPAFDQLNWNSCKHWYISYIETSTTVHYQRGNHLK